MTDRDKVIERLYDCLAASRPENLWIFVQKDIVGDALVLLKEQERRINELEEKIRLMEYGNQDTLQSYMMPAT